MNQKLLFQFFLILVMLVLIALFYSNFFKKEISNEEKYSEDSDTISDMIEGIKYFSKDKNGNTYLVEAQSGKSGEEGSDLITLYKVTAKLKFDDVNYVDVYSDTAIYNTINNDTKFYDNVKLIYQEHNIICDNIIVEFSTNYAKLHGNLIYNKLNTKLFADQIEIDLINRTTKTSMFNKNDNIRIINTNGINQNF
jgi:hypothetical protein